MKKTKAGKIIVKVTMLLAMICSLVSILIMQAPTSVAYALEATMLNKVNGESYFWGAPALSDPVKTQVSASEYYFAPSSYIYFGDVYNTVTNEYEPVLCRVLDADADNTGASGAVFVLMENAYSRYRFSKYDFYSKYIDSENIYTTSLYASYDVNDAAAVFGSLAGAKVAPGEMDYVRPVTKTDKLDALNGLYGYEVSGITEFAWETDTANEAHPNANWYTMANEGAEEAQLLNGTKFFLLSAEELATYVGNYNSSNLLAYDVENDAATSWWLRTGMMDYYNEQFTYDNGGNYVGVVDENGNVIPYSADSSDPKARMAFNVVLDDVAYSREVGRDTYSLTFWHPDYMEGSDIGYSFEAKIVETKDHNTANVVTVEYKNYIATSAVGDETSYISVIIEDENGNIKYYNTIAELPENEIAEKYITDTATASFILPGDYKPGSDNVKIFWERKQANQESVGFVSNMVELDCPHTVFSILDSKYNYGEYGSCVGRPVCSICGEEFDTVNPDRHVISSSDDYSYTNNDVDGDPYKHFKNCPECGVTTLEEECTFDGTCMSKCSKCYQLTPDNDIGHSYDENGICIYNESHYEPAEIIESAVMPYVDIKNEGQWNSFASFINSGESAYKQVGKYKYHIYAPGAKIKVNIKENLDFFGINFIPIGTSEHPAQNMDVYFQGYESKITGVYFNNNNSNLAGLFGAAKGVYIHGPVMITDSDFRSASNAGSIIGLDMATSAEEGNTISNVIVWDGEDGSVTVNAEDGVQGSFIGYATEYSSIISGCYAFNVKNNKGELIPFSGSGLETVTRSMCQYYGTDTDPIDESLGERSLEDFNNGRVAYELRTFANGWGVWGQVIDEIDRDTEKPLPKDKFPVLGSNHIVISIAYCDGTPSYYTNIYRWDKVLHVPAEFHEFVWYFDNSADAKVTCALCGEVVLHPVEVEFNSKYVPVRGIYTAKLEIDGVEYTDVLDITGVFIQDMIGMTPIVKDFDGREVSPEDLMKNHRLNDGTTISGEKEYEVHFVNSETGEAILDRYWADIDVQGFHGYIYYGVAVSEAGVYDLVVTGKNDYEGQVYTYESVLTINPITVEITPLDVYKHYDGSTDFEPKYEVVNSQNSDLIYFDLSYSAAPSAKVGSYTLDVTVKNTEYEGSINYILTRDTVNAYILPELYVSIENSSYPTALTYGDTVPEPTAEYFTVTDGAELSFEWYEADMSSIHSDERGETIYNTNSLKPLDTKPRNAGTYVLRVKASATDTAAANTLDIIIEIEKRELSYNIIIPEGTQTVIDSGEIYYLIDSFDLLDVEIFGLAEGDTVESAGISANISILGITNDTVNSMPDRSCYYVSYSLSDAYGNYVESEDHGENTTEIYMCTAPVGYPSPLFDDQLYNGATQSYGVTFSWAAPNEDDGVDFKIDDYYGAYFEYRVKIYDSNGGLVNEKTVGRLDAVESNIHTFNLQKSGQYTVVINVRVVDFRNVGAPTYSLENFYNYSFTVDIENTDTGDSVEQIRDTGRYIITVTTTDGDNKAVKSEEYYVRREVVMNIKECEVELDGGEVVFNKTNIVMEAGKVILLGHELVSITCEYSLSGYIWIGSYKIIDIATGKDVSHLYRITTSQNGDHRHGGFGVAHIFDSACDSDCNVEACKYTRAATHTGGRATCTELAVCDACGSYYGSIDPRNHTSTATAVKPNGEDLETHIEVYLCCGKGTVISSHTVGTPATCISVAICADCGWKFGELDPDNHANGERSYEYLGEGGHRKTFECCGATVNEDHSGGEATCLASAVCEYCEKSYGQFDPNNHAGKIDCSYDANTPDVHYEYYNCCERGATVAHSGGDATCIARAVCERCLAEYGEVELQDHVTEEITYTRRTDNASMHDMCRSCCAEYLGKAYHSGGEGNCISAAVCEYCSAEYGETLNASNHASDELVYKLDGSIDGVHAAYRACCGEYMTIEAHFGGTANCQRGVICERCGYEYGEPAEHSYDNACDAVCNECGIQMRSEVFHVDENEDYACDECGAELEHKTISGGGISAIVTGSAVVTSAGGFSLFWFVIKKKSWAELLKLLIG